ncbi:anthranilate phosphoribosyltransferase [Pyrococcus furiosus DSM 3638]|uniref:Anthranilate phosphoribosyltransferase n=3 Tax=Pyrococcus furiosus TaxID=2261 RepID=TRPD_PYRFU|nr:anthranilate phosphoribosyltransferase [Pyrococcus furiosus]Q8U089.1 RecName: Full=Anthranilate phosphoribosyltransferase [Pyrococcus furiosus DSM 3638]AAL81834.1 anthranilate phosphoribosyltransferase [Pyrococcus furiosus DSM 3638]AFN04930.1 anthranilate phosphoribosyltransferase [Pyrococcus furiosus COM1]QEK79327.1 anthranilate phosphoribosyltransferase [Pyrococcus furiosus DSM 3638]
MLEKIVENRHLSFEEAYDLFNILKEESEVRIAAYLAALQTKGYTSEEIAGFAKAMRDNAIKLDLGEVLDTAGTGGDKSFTINVSTASALILSEYTKVAKHGNVSVTSRSGSANLLEALGINIKISPEKAKEMIEKVNFTFIFAPMYHPALKRIMPVRKELGIKTIFNILGPLANPANPAYQVVGVNSRDLVEKMARALNYLGVKRATVVHGSGLDEISPEKETIVAEVNRGDIDFYTVTPEDFGLARTKVIPCYSPEESAERIRAVLRGNGKNEDRNFVLINSAMALYTIGIASDLKEGVELAENVLGEKIIKKLEEIACLSKS